MKITTRQSDLLKALRTVRRAVPSRSVMPITDNVLIDADESGRVELTATSLDITIKASVVPSAQDRRNWYYCTTSKDFLWMLLVVMVKGHVDIESTETPFGAKISNTMQLLGGRVAESATQLFGASPEDFPSITVF